MRDVESVSENEIFGSLRLRVPGVSDLSEIRDSSFDRREHDDSVLLDWRAQKFYVIVKPPRNG